MARVLFERRITLEEADCARIRVSTRLCEDIRSLGPELRARVGGRWFEAAFEVDLCHCAGIQRPHDHAFLVLRGEPELVPEERVVIEVVPRR